MPQRPPRLTSRGFTLIEMLVVVVILGIAAAVVLPQVGAASGIKLSAAARTLMSDLLYAQNRAISTQQRHYFRVSGLGTDTQTLELLAVPLDGGDPVPVRDPTQGGNFAVRFGQNASPGLAGVTLVASTYAGDSALVGYDELGAPVTLNPATNAVAGVAPDTLFRLTCGEQHMTVKIEPMTGDVSAE